MKQLFYFVSLLFFMFSCDQRGEKVVHIHKYEDNQYFRQQLRYLNELIDDDDENTHAYFLKAKLYQNNRQYAKALVEIDKAIKLQANFPNYYYLQGEIFYKQKEWKKAHRIEGGCRPPPSTRPRRR